MVRDQASLLAAKGQAERLQTPKPLMFRRKASPNLFHVRILGSDPI